MKLLNLGCGKRFHPSWTNIDSKSPGPGVMAHDLTKGIPFEELSVDVVYHSHLLEHFSKEGAIAFLKECHRVLKNNGILRVVVPDLEQIVRLYLSNLDSALAGNADAAKRYDWMTIELLDQLSRHVSGGEMLRHWSADPMPAGDFVLQRMGSELKNTLAEIRKTGKRLPSPAAANDPLLVGKFRLSGEAHQWMYDRYSLSKLMEETGFMMIRRVSAFESGIPGFNGYRLDSDDDGNVRKPDSLFMEAVKSTGHGGKALSFSAGKTTAVTGSPRIVHLCTQDTGGAGIAAMRLHIGLVKTGMDSTFLVLNKKSGDTRTFSLSSQFKGAKIWERWKGLLNAFPNHSPDLDLFTDSHSDIRLAEHPAFPQADVINLHWIPGLIRYDKMAGILGVKPVVWTLHDMNPFTGGCHFAGTCGKYKTGCGACPQLGSTDENDLSRKIFLEKQAAYANLNLTIVTPSRWLADCAGKSALFRGRRIDVIPYGFPLDTFKPRNKAEARTDIGIPVDGKVVLFGAHTLTNKRKGFQYLLEALDKFPETERNHISLLLFGSADSAPALPKGFKAFSAGKISDDTQLAAIYNAADVFVMPTQEDNLPNTVAEAMACGIPVAGFNVGGMPDMIRPEHTGQLAPLGNTGELFDGIRWVLQLDPDEYTAVSANCRRFVETNLSLERQAERYSALYDSLEAELVKPALGDQPPAVKVSEPGPFLAEITRLVEEGKYREAVEKFTAERINYTDNPSVIQFENLIARLRTMIR